MDKIVSPSLLACDFLNLGAELKAFDNVEDLWFHIDVMDAHFVPNLTFGHPVVKKLQTVTKKKLDAHFMVTDPTFFADNFKDCGIHNFSFHWEATNHHDRLISYLKDLYPSVGIALNPSTPIEAIPDYLLSRVDLVLLMSVNPGFGGQKFIESTVEKTKSLNQKREKLQANFQIQIDGGVTNKNAMTLRDAGANNLVAGSYIFKGQPSEYQQLADSLR
ncbi:MAG: ribulose-phosphate 3-epimerase [Bacteriovoracaceae bacterium]|jgi:ribulose-phosphate 3-epimerase|nr:ribulose-phosphate 3-epimerase [Bacteriovoracaceae bacterium]